MKARANRIRGYLRESFPIAPNLIVSALIYASIALYCREIHGFDGNLTIYDAVGACSVFGILLILRLMDELKDEDIDRRLFPERALPSGRISRNDIRWALACAVALYVAINLASGWAVAVAAVVLAYAFLMFRRFFAADVLRRSLPLTLVTHNPITALVIVHGFAVSAVSAGLSMGALRWELIAPFVVMMWMPFTAWEFARKIRAPEHEDEYVTYSRIFGARGAVVAMWGAQAIALAIAAVIWRALDLPPPGLICLGAGATISAWAGIRFMRNPGAGARWLKPAASLFMLSVVASQIVALSEGVAA